MGTERRARLRELALGKEGPCRCGVGGGVCLSSPPSLPRARPVINILNKTFTVTPSKVDPARCTTESW